MVNDGRRGLYPDFHAFRPHTECQVGIFVVGRRIMGIKTTEITKQLRTQHDASAGTIVYFPCVQIVRLVRVVATAIVPAGPIVENNAACLL